MSEDEPFPEIDTPEWGKMNVRRADLILRRVYHPETMSAEEIAEFECLQSMMRASLRAAHPRPTAFSGGNAS